MRSEGIRCILYKPEYNISSKVAFDLSVVATFERTSVFHWETAETTMGSRSQVGSSEAMYWHALSESTKETPSLDFTAVVFGEKVNRPPTRRP